MNSQPRHDSMVEEQAALWAARLDGDVLDADQRAALDAWLAEAPGHRTLLSQYCQFSADLEEKVQALVDTGAMTLPAQKKTKQRRHWSFTAMTTVALAAAAVIAVAVWVALPKPHVQTIAKGVAERGVYVLADGTRVELNAQTSLRFENSNTERRVRLAGGEALFVVTKDPARPFIVETPSGSVRVTGTTFNVRHDGTGVALEVTVLEGSVQVRPSDPAGDDASGPVPLSAGEQLSVDAGVINVRPLSPDALDDTLAWRDGQIVFANVPLREVAKRFEHYHGRRINVSPAAGDIPLGGRYGLDDLKAFTAALEVALPALQVRYDEPSGAVTIRLRTGG